MLTACNAHLEAAIIGLTPLPPDFAGDSAPGRWKLTTEQPGCSAYSKPPLAALA